MSNPVMLRFPAQRREFRLSAKKPTVGDVLKRNGDTWVVVAVEEAKDGTSVVTLRPASESPR